MSRASQSCIQQERWFINQRIGVHRPNDANVIDVFWLYW